MTSDHQPTDTALPAGVDELFTVAAHDGVIWRFCNGPRQPTLIAGTDDWGFVDPAVLRGLDNVLGAFMPGLGRHGHFTPVASLVLGERVLTTRPLAACFQVLLGNEGRSQSMAVPCSRDRPGG
ncbi:hypothetical protein [Saccharomonospora iraqiensis]|uniref:hypothetical protein n=1 Tax=Saccharomonospora iraqiensis TaxID=52698 RepID=UPI0012B67B5A|nr:hypothetical protein [Saccharomonospora iraqiensis]